MKLTIDIHPSMIGSPKEIGELVEKQFMAEVEGKRRDIAEGRSLLKRLTNAKDTNDFMEILSGKKMW